MDFHLTIIKSAFELTPIEMQLHLYSYLSLKICFLNRWLEINFYIFKELLRARQRCIQIESDLEQLQQSHWALLDEYGRLQDDFRWMCWHVLQYKH